jgi:hypothetical protein
MNKCENCGGMSNVQHFHSGEVLVGKWCEPCRNAAQKGYEAICQSFADGSWEKRLDALYGVVGLSVYSSECPIGKAVEMIKGRKAGAV